MKALLTFIILLLSTLLLISQNGSINYRACTNCNQNFISDDISLSLYQYGVSTPFLIQDIESDFDLRRAGGDTRWHKGLDLRNHGPGNDQQRGDALFSADSNGIVTQLQFENYKYIIIDGDTLDFGYGHIFSHVDLTVDNPYY